MLLILTVMAVVSLTILLGVVHRLHQLSDLVLAGLPTAARPGAPAGGDYGAPLPLPGTDIGDFTVVMTDGGSLTRSDLTGRGLIGFFSIGCPLCKEFAPAFEALAGSFPGGRSQVLAVVIGIEGEPDEFAERLRPVARVVAGPKGMRVSDAFGIFDLPAFCLVENTVVIAAALKPEALRLPALATLQ